MSRTARQGAAAAAAKGLRMSSHSTLSRRTRVISLVTAALVAMGALAGAAPASASALVSEEASWGVVSGTVHFPAGYPGQGADTVVALYQWQDDGSMARIATVTPSESGEWSVSEVEGAVVPYVHDNLGYFTGGFRDLYGGVIRNRAAAPLWASPASGLDMWPTAATTPANDDAADATELTSLPYVDQPDLTVATREVGGYDSDRGSHSIWYSITPSATDRYVFSTSDTEPDFDTFVALYTPDESEFGWVLDTWNDDTIGTDSRLSVNLQAGVTYLIRLTGLADDDFGWTTFTAERQSHISGSAILPGDWDYASASPKPSLIAYTEDTGVAISSAVIAEDGSFDIGGLSAGDEYTLYLLSGPNGDGYLLDGPDWWEVVAQPEYADVHTAPLSGYEITLPLKPFSATTIPQIAGGGVVSNVLTASLPNAWTPAATEVSYTWMRDSATVIGTGTTYQVQMADVGHVVTVIVDGSRPGYRVEGMQSEAVVVAAPTGTFSLTPVPEVTGTAKVGRTLTATAADFSPVAELTIAWYRGDTAIEGATDWTYTAVAADRGALLHAEVTGRLLDTATVTVSSADTAKVTAGTIKPAPAPAIRGKAKAGKKVTVDVGEWMDGVDTEIRWYAGGKKIPKATKASYTIAKKYRGKKLTVKVTGSLDGYGSVTKTSASKRIS